MARKKQLYGMGGLPFWIDEQGVAHTNEEPTDFPEIQVPSEDVGEALSARLPEEETPVTAGLGVQETEPGMGGREALGTYTQEDVGEPVSDEQAKRWMEETQIESARIELEMLRDKMLNSRRDLVDELYGGDDPSLRNTKPIADELRKMELKSFKDSAGDPEEMTPRERLLYAAEINNISKDVTVRVESDKQQNMEQLNDAVTQYNQAISGQMTGLQTELTTIQEKHAQEDEAKLEAETKLEAERIKAAQIKPEYKPGQALEKIASAQRAKATFNKTGKVDAIMAKMFPEYTEGQKLSKKEIAKVNKSYDRLIKHLEGFAPESSKRDQAIKQLQNAGQPVTEGNIEYIMGQF